MDEYKEMDALERGDSIDTLSSEINDRFDDNEEGEPVADEIFPAIKFAFRKSTNPADLLSLLVQFAVLCHQYPRHRYSPAFEENAIHKYLVKCLDPCEDIQLRYHAIVLILNMSSMSVLDYFTLLVRQGLPKILLDVANEGKIELISPCMSVITNLCCHLPQFQEFYFASIDVSKLLQVAFPPREETSGIFDYILMFFRTRSPALERYVTDEHVDMYLSLLVDLIRMNPDAIRDKYIHLEILSFVMTRCDEGLIAKHGLAQSLFALLQLPNLDAKFITTILACLSEVFEYNVTEEMNPLGLINYLHPEADVIVRTAAVYCLEKMFTSTPEVIPVMCDANIIPILLDIIEASKALLKKEASSCLAMIFLALPQCLDGLDLIAIIGVICDVIMTMKTPLLVQTACLLVHKIVAELGEESMEHISHEVDIEELVEILLESDDEMDQKYAHEIIGLLSPEQ